MKFEVKSANEWLYPDSIVSNIGQNKIKLSSAKAGHASCQILFNGLELNKKIEYEINCPENIKCEMYRLIDIYVEKNTGVAGFCAEEGESVKGYTTRSAPFRVYDALKPFGDDEKTGKGTEALYIAFKVGRDLKEGIYRSVLKLKIGEKIAQIPVSIEVFDVVIPEKESLNISNWFSIDNMAAQHGLKKWSEDHWKMIRQYGLLMRRIRQTHFLIPKEVISAEKAQDGRYIFNFDRAKRLIELYLSLGFKYIEGNPVAYRRDFNDSYFVADYCGKAVRALSSEGYEYISQYLTAWRKLLNNNGWLNITVQHVADEPTKACATEYRIISGIVRKFMPGVRLMDAVEYCDLDGSVDIWIPKNAYYQENRDEFERKRVNGDELWFYTCCIPGGYYLNRLLDMPLIRTRYLHWGNYIYNLKGYLHWGFNFCDNDQDPFNQKNLVFPPGDTHITYPGNDGPWGSMRLEAMRAGIEDYELLKILESKNKQLSDEIAARCLKDFNHADENIEHFEASRNMLLSAASDNLDTKILSSLFKVFPDVEPQEEHIQASAIKGEYFSFQIAYRSKKLIKKVLLSIESDLKENISLYSVGLVPSGLPCYPDHDEFLLRTEPGLYPDPLYPVKEYVSAQPKQWQALWVTVKVPRDIIPGVHKIKIIFCDEEGKYLNSRIFKLEIIDAVLPEQKLIHTEWFYTDCLATWYNVEAFSDEHFKIIEKYIECYVEHGMNMILTPLFTPPLETEVGKERPTTQLVKVIKREDNYSFDFSLLDRWVKLCLGRGIKYFEFCHLFTQWGAKHAPKVMSEVDGKVEQVFGWETDATGEEYSNFLLQFMSALKGFIRARGLESCVYFHISDEPGLDDIGNYKKARELVSSDFPVMDALSDYEFYKKGLVDCPVASTEHIGTFIDNHVKSLWAYYCCCEYKKLSNRFFNMPSARTRIIGMQLYKYGINGFLHWGFNHWYSQKSLYRIDPFKVTDAGHAFPSGDAFLVYPGDDGPITSIRLKLMREAMQDICALELLESTAGKDYVMGILERTGPLTFTEYERDSSWLLNTREMINDAIKKMETCING
ncbi:MAG: DUF4091 domain-containing protein [Clostridiales bacterium]|nr:DUF4091 domain-containing protein [Clostridiales bacterium]